MKENVISDPVDVYRDSYADQSRKSTVLMLKSMTWESPQVTRVTHSLDLYHLTNSEIC